MPTPKAPDATSLFAEFEPFLFDAGRGAGSAVRARKLWTVRRDHGVQGTYVLHNPNDVINEHRPYLEKILVEYRIGRNKYPLFTMSDFFETGYDFDVRGEGNLLGDLAERISRRVVKYFLKHYNREGHTGGIFDKSFGPATRHNYVVANTDTYVLKIQKYPNLVILKKSASGKYGYENIKELDGLFDYRFKKRRHILVLESKLDKININVDDLVNNLFTPLREVFPDALFSYIMFSDRKSIFKKTLDPRIRELKPTCLAIAKHLGAHDVKTMFFSFNESYCDFERMKNHLITQYRWATSLRVQFNGRITLSDREIVLFDEGETPRIKLSKDNRTGLWREVHLVHKDERRRT